MHLGNEFKSVGQNFGDFSKKLRMCRSGALSFTPDVNFESIQSVLLKFKELRLTPQTL